MENNSTNTDLVKARANKLIPYVFFAFFAVVFVINFAYIYLAQKTWRGIETENAYQKGLNYNQTIAQVKMQQALGWKFEVKYLPLQKNVGQLTACLLDKNGQKISDAKLVAKLARPIQEGYDFSQNLLPQDNCYFAKINFPLKGQWSVEIQAFKGDDVFQIVKRYVVQ